jgi:hypothetical protein
MYKLKRLFKLVFYIDVYISAHIKIILITRYVLSLYSDYGVDIVRPFNVSSK